MNKYLWLLIILPTLVLADGDRDDGDVTAGASAGAEATSGSSSSSSIKNTTSLSSEMSVNSPVNMSTDTIAIAPPGLGDVDIAQCLGSEAWSFLIGGKQMLVLNEICMAEFYLKQGRYDLAAQALCNQPEILKEYVDEDACEKHHDFTPMVIENNEEVQYRGEIIRSYVDDHEVIDAQRAVEIAEVREEIKALRDQLNRPAPIPEQRTIIEQRPLFDNATIDAILALKIESEEENDE